MLDAGNTQALIGTANARLIAANTSTDVIEPAGPRLCRHKWITDHGSGHTAKIGVAAGDQLFGDLRLIDAPGRNHRPFGCLLDRRSKGRDVAVRQTHGRYDVNRTAKTGRGARNHAQIIDLAGNCATDLQHVGLRQPLRVHLIA